MEFRCLGPLELEADGLLVELGGRQQRLVLALLLANVNEVVSTDRLIDGIWGESPPPTARKTLQGYVSALRKALPAGSSLKSRAPGYVLEAKPQDIDAHCFEPLAAEGASQVTSNPQQAGRLLRRALSLWRGGAFQDLADTEALRPEIARLDALRAAALEARLAADIFSGQEAVAAAELEDMTRRHPLRERFWVLRMLALYRTGRQSEALRVFEEARIVLAEEVGLEPGPAMRMLEQRMLEQSPVLETLAALEVDVSAVEHGGRNPYKGLRAFEEADADDFFGRDALVRRLREALERRRSSHLVVLAGPSGSGKSSVVRAGLVPELRSQGTQIVAMYPGSTPQQALTAATERLSPAQKSVLIIDQMEELFTLGSPDEQAAVLDALSELATMPSGPWVLVTIRADFLDRLLDRPRFAGLVEDGLLLVTPLDDHEVREVVVKPASRVGMSVDPDLVAAAIAQVSRRPSILPLLEYALTDLHDRAGTQTMALAALEAAGGISGALVKRAEETLAGLDPTGRETARQIFLRLVTLTEAGEPMRRRVTKDVLGVLPQSDGVMSVLGEYRLLTFDRDATGRPTVQLAHEALIREWPRLAGWIDQARDTIHRYRQLAEAAADWADNDRADAYLLSGPQLLRFSDWSDADLALSGDEEAFLGSSRQLEAERRRRQRRRRALTLAGFAAAAGIALILALAASVARNDAQSQAELAQQRSELADSSAELAEQNQREAEAERDRATTEAQRALANELNAAALAVVDADPELAILLSLQSLAISPDAQVSLDHKTTLRRAVEADILIQRHTVAAPGELLSLDIAPDGSRLAYWIPGELRIVDTATWETRWTYANDALHPDPNAPTNVGAPVFSPDGRLVAIGTVEPSSRLLILDASTGSPVDQVQFAEAPCGAAHTGPQAWSGDGRHIGVLVHVDCFGPFGESSLQILEFGTWEVAAEIPVFGQAVFAEDAPRMAAIEYPATGFGGRALIFDTDAFELIGDFGSTSGDLDPDGRMFAAADPDASSVQGLELYDLDTGLVVDRLTGLDRRPALYATDYLQLPGGDLIVVGTDGQSTGIWDARTGSLVRSLPTGEVNSLGSDHIAQLLYTASTGGTISVWDFSPGGEAAPDNLLFPYWFEANMFSVNPESRLGVALHWVDTGIQSFSVFDTATGSLRGTLIEEVAHLSAAALPGGRVLFIRGDSAAGVAGPLAVWDPITGEAADFVGCATRWDDWESGPTGEPSCIDGGTLFMPTGFPVSSSDGTELVAMDYRGAAHVWDASTLEHSDTLDVGGVIEGHGVVAAVGRDWILVRRLGERRFIALDRPSLAVTAEFDFALFGNVEVSADGSFLLVRHLDTSIHRIETDDWQIRQLFNSGHLMRGLALSPSGDRVMLGGTDEFVRIIDAVSGQLLDQVPYRHVSDGHWTDDDHIAVGTGQTGTWGMITLAFDEIVEGAVGQLSRGFTNEECALYRIDPCVTLDGMRSASTRRGSSGHG